MHYKLISFSLILITCFLTSVELVSAGFTNETDRWALLAIKDLIREDPFNFLISWNSSRHFCQWRGVTCSRRRQRVTELDMGSQKLVGSVSPHIGNLSFLRTIALENNSFHGTIPQQIGRLFRLQYLYLYTNSLHGELPASISHCSNIKVLSVANNNLGGKLPTQLGSLSNLLRILLTNNHFTGHIPPSFGNLSSLRNLGLSRNNLEGEIPSELGQLSNLEIFHLSTNNLIGIVPPPIYNISSIYVFAVVLNQLHGNLPPDLGLTLSNLQEIYVGQNNFSGPFPLSIANASGLVRVDFSSNSITGPVPINLGSLRDLELVNLSGNQLGTNEPNELSFIDSLINCTNLRALALQMSGFGGMLPNSIMNLSTTLTLLAMPSNYISGSIPREIGNLFNLVLLDFSHNMLRGSIPESLGRLTKLQGLSLDENSISGEIPLSIGNMTQLSQLALGDNLLQGSIPISLAKITNLQELDLAINGLTGVIPDQIMGLATLSVLLDLQQNKFTGQLPSQVGNLKNIGNLSVAGNKLRGEIPSTLGNCLVLEMLDMKGNLFEGPIPSTFKQLKGIQVLDLSNNNLSGHIPSFLGELPFIQNLNISHNNFEGEVPTIGVFSNISSFSIVGNVKLCGGIQALQLPACPTKIHEKKKKHLHRSIILLVIILPTIMLLACLYGILYRTRRSKQQTSSASLLHSHYPRLSYAELLQATNGFSSTNLIGEGRYGSVYKGILNPGEQIVAVKVLNLQQRGADKSFLAECETLRNTRHRNLVKIITSCSSIDFKGGDFKALVFEFMPNGSLESWLHPTQSEQQDSKNLNLIQRLNIAIDVASALDYLHHHCETTISHCDLKPSNVLLNDDLCAHVGDFGLARFLLAFKSTSNLQQSSSTGIRGTIGYVAPEYGMGEEVSTQGDVYSYGILLLEMFTGKRPTDSKFMDNFNLHNYVKMALPDRVLEIVDPTIILTEDDGSNKTREGEDEIAKMGSCLASILRIGVLCSVELPIERMDVKDVIMELDVIRNVL